MPSDAPDNGQPDNSLAQIYQEHQKGLILDGAKTYTIVYGDTLTGIAKKEYGTDKGYFFPLIMSASSGEFSDPDKILPDRKLTVPDLKANMDNADARATLKDCLNDVADFYGSQKNDTAMVSGLHAAADTL
jgi:hypothetical protein